MRCKHCEHLIGDHGDRAVRACAPELATNIHAETGRRIPRASGCDCPGWEAEC